MNETEPANHAHGGANSDSTQPNHGPYWKRAHHDWRFWVAAILIFTAMTIYVLTDEFALRADSRLPPSYSESGGR